MNSGIKTNTGGVWIKVPACLAIILCLAMAFSILRPDSGGGLAVRYQSLAQKSLDDKNYATAIVASWRLLGFGGPYRNDALFKLAQATLGLGQVGEATNLMEMVAPQDKPVYAPAHLFVARTLMARGSQTTFVKNAIEAQLRNALTLEPDSREAKALVTRFHEENTHP